MGFGTSAEVFGHLGGTGVDKKAAGTQWSERQKGPGESHVHG